MNCQNTYFEKEHNRRECRGKQLKRNSWFLGGLLTVSGIAAGFGTAWQSFGPAAAQSGKLEIAISVVEAFAQNGVVINATAEELATSPDPGQAVKDAIDQAFASISTQGQWFDFDVAYNLSPSGWPVVITDYSTGNEVRATVNGQDINLELAIPTPLPSPYASCSLILLEKPSEAENYGRARISQTC